MKYIVSIFILLLLGIVSEYTYMYYHTKKISTDYKNTTYIIDGQSITLKNGAGTIASTADSASKTTVLYFGNDAIADMDGDGIKDIGFLVTENTGGSGTFYYVAFARGTSHGYTGENMLFLGDRIAPQTTEYRDGQLIVNYADRKPTDPMTASPSIGVSKYFTVANELLVEKK